MSNARKNAKAAIPTARHLGYTWLMRIKPKHTKLMYSARVNQAAEKTRVTKLWMNFCHRSNASIIATAQKYTLTIVLMVRAMLSLMMLKNAAASEKDGL